MEKKVLLTPKRDYTESTDTVVLALSKDRKRKNRRKQQLDNFTTTEAKKKKKFKKRICTEALDVKIITIKA